MLTIPHQSTYPQPPSSPHYWPFSRAASCCILSDSDTPRTPLIPHLPPVQRSISYGQGPSLAPSRRRSWVDVAVRESVFGSEVGWAAQTVGSRSRTTASLAGWSRRSQSDGRSNRLCRQSSAGHRLGSRRATNWGDCVSDLVEEE